MASSAHDSYEDHTEIAGSSDRAFGLTVGGILAAIGAVRWFFFDAGQLSTAFLVVPGVLLVLVALVRPGLLAPLNKLWTKLGLLLAAIVNPIIMGLIYFFLFVPIGLGMQLFGRDPLRQRRAEGQDTYWISREQAGPAPETMKNQF